MELVHNSGSQSTIYFTVQVKLLYLGRRPFVFDIYLSLHVLVNN